jgi:hypothetical protein
MNAYSIVREPESGYRANAGICVLDSTRGCVLAFQSLDLVTWMLPQGGINREETPEQAGQMPQLDTSLLFLTYFMNLHGFRGTRNCL